MTGAGNPAGAGGWASATGLPAASCLPVATAGVSMAGAGADDIDVGTGARAADGPSAVDAALMWSVRVHHHEPTAARMITPPTIMAVDFVRSAIGSDPCNRTPAYRRHSRDGMNGSEGADVSIAGFAPASASPRAARERAMPLPDARADVALSPVGVVRQVGNPDTDDRRSARTIRTTIPDSLRQAAYRKESAIERRFRDSRASRVMAPTTDALYDFIGRAMCGLPLFDEAAA